MRPRFCQGLVVLFFVIMLAMVGCAGKQVVASDPLAVQPPWTQVKQIALDKGTLLSTGCKSYHILSTDMEVVFVYCSADDSIGLIRHTTSEVTALGSIPGTKGTPRVCVLVDMSTGVVQRLANDVGAASVYDIFRLLVSQKLL